MRQYKYLIVGGGMAADAAVKGIRQVDERGAIGVIGAEPDPPYKRPPLTKALWTKGKSIDDIWCGTAAKGAELIQAARAVSLDPGQQEVRDDGGTVYRYERLLLATGGTPRRLPFGGDHLLYYRTLSDYRRLRELTERGERFAVLGGGFIGSELAAALTINRKKVFMVFPEAGVAGRLLPPNLAQALNAYYEAKGVTVLANRKPSGIAAEHGAITVRLENGQRFSVDGVVAGLGIAPDTQLAAEAGLEVDDGIVVDDRLRTRDPRVFAAGDVASVHNPVLDRRLRVEHEDNALTMGKAAGRNMAGADEPCRHLPFFYSDLFDLGYEAVGDTDPSLSVVTAIQDLKQKGVIFYLKDGRVRGVIFWNTFDKVDAGRELIATPGPHTADDLEAWASERLVV